MHSNLELQKYTCLMFRRKIIPLLFYVIVNLMEKLSAEKSLINLFIFVQ